MRARLEQAWYQPPSAASLGERVLFSPLSVAAALFGLGVRARNALYDGGALASTRVDARVISVGNLTVGGAGKTPAVIHLARRAAARGLKVAVLSRGYGRKATDALVFGGAGVLPPADECGDEPWMIARACPEASVLVGADRAELALRARRELGADVLFLDDGFQHRKLVRDLNIVVVDEASGFGNGKLLPRGPLREPLSALGRADLIWLRVADGPSARFPDWKVPVVRARYAVDALVAPDGGEHAPTVWRGRRAVALAGVARPERFAASLKGQGIEVVGRYFFPDHHRFSLGELDEVRAEADRLGALIATTEKDSARLPRGYPAWVARLGVEVLSGAEALCSALGF